MKISEKILLDYEGLCKYGPINIVAFGDSVTHGALGADEIDQDTVYWSLLRKMILKKRDYVPVNVINAGIGGSCAAGSLTRIDSHVLKHQPDLIIICFGLNDVNGTLERYIKALRTIFEKCKNCGAQVIFMTPNMLNTYVADDTQEKFKEYALKTAEMQNSGKMDSFMDAAVLLAKEMDVTVCDCYAKWKELSKTTDTTMLLANRINHPTREMHKLFAESLYGILFSDDIKIENTESTMYRG